MDWKGGYKNSAFYSTFGFGFSPGCHGGQLAFGRNIHRIAAITTDQT